MIRILHRIVADDSESRGGCAVLALAGLAASGVLGAITTVAAVIL